MVFTALIIHFPLVNETLILNGGSVELALRIIYDDAVRFFGNNETEVDSGDPKSDTPVEWADAYGTGFS